jgi:hypothetical protein
MKMKILLRIVVSVLWIGVVVALSVSAYAGQLPNSRPPQVIHLDDGTKLTLVGTAFGIHQPTDVWIQAEHDPDKWPNYELVVSDPSNTASVNVERRKSSHVRTGVDEQWFELSAFPRWDKTTILRVKPNGGAISKEAFVITNPAPATITNWTPEPLPVTKSDGDLEVTLTKFVSGALFPYRQGEHPLTNDPANQCVHLNFDVQQNGQPATNWQAWPVETSDATGNHVRGLIRSYPTNGVIQIWGRMHNGAYIPPPKHYGMDGYFYRPGLWPDQSPWKIRLEFIQRSGFSDDEIVTFTNVPVKLATGHDWDDEWGAWDIGKTNFPFTVTPATVREVHLKLLPPLLLTNRWDRSQMDLSIIIGADPGYKPRGMNLTVVAATDDQGRDLWSFETPAWAGHYSIEFARVHDDIKSLNLKLALHQSRFVEFTVQPAKP